MEDYSNFTIQNLKFCKSEPCSQTKDGLIGEDRHMLSFTHTVEFHIKSRTGTAPSNTLFKRICLGFLRAAVILFNCV